jgi:L-ascorbate metabolism protein UlaG (beta-lactamase superfamily)
MGRIRYALILLLVITGCNSSQPTQTIQITKPLATPPTLSPTHTSIATGEPTAKIEVHAPLIGELPEQTINDGESFSKIFLDNYVSDDEHKVREITWNASGNIELEVSIGSRVLMVTLPHHQWTGSETILLEACDPEGLCDTKDMVFTVLEQNDHPVVADIFPQMISVGGTFSGINLEEIVTDVDNPDDEVTWQISGNIALDVQIVDQVVSIVPIDLTWHGSERIRFEACDPGGLCDSTEASFLVVAENDVAITYLGNEGFLIFSGGKKVLVDALFRPDLYQIPPNLIDALRFAQPPFDRVDLILVTHNHPDHFEPTMVRSHLQNNPDVVFVSTSDAVSRLGTNYDGFDQLQDRVISVQITAGETAQYNTSGTALEIIRLPHADNPVANLGFLFTVGDNTFLHVGDYDYQGDDPSSHLAYMQAFNLPGKEIDFAFLPWYLLTNSRNRGIINDEIHADLVIPMHHSSYSNGDPEEVQRLLEGIANNFPHSILFYQVSERWIMSSEPVD